MMMPESSSQRARLSKPKARRIISEALRIDLMVALAGIIAQSIYRAQYTKGLDHIEEWDSDRRGRNRICSGILR